MIKSRKQLWPGVSPGVGAGGLTVSRCRFHPQPNCGYFFFHSSNTASVTHLLDYCSATLEGQILFVLSWHCAILCLGFSRHPTLAALYTEIPTTFSLWLSLVYALVWYFQGLLITIPADWSMTDMSKNFFMLTVQDFLSEIIFLS